MVSFPKGFLLPHWHRIHTTGECRAWGSLRDGFCIRISFGILGFCPRILSFLCCGLFFRLLAFLEYILLEVKRFGFLLFLFYRLCLLFFLVLRLIWKLLLNLGKACWKQDQIWLSKNDWTNLFHKFIDLCFYLSNWKIFIWK